MNIGEFDYEFLGRLITKLYGSSLKFAEELKKRGVQKTAEAINKWRQGVSIPRVNELHIIASVLELKIADLFFSDDRSTMWTEKNNDADILNIPILSHQILIGTKSDNENVEAIDTPKAMPISKFYFKTPQNREHLRVTNVDGYSMIPMLIPDSHVIFDITITSYMGDGLYVINFKNILMVKLLQITERGTLKIISVSKEYESYEADINYQRVMFSIIGKVIKTIM
jgi:hypothetical protein